MRCTRVCVCVCVCGWCISRGSGGLSKFNLTDGRIHTGGGWGQSLIQESALPGEILRISEQKTDIRGQTVKFTDSS